MDPITAIEQAIKDVLLTIDASTNPATDYTYNYDVTIVNVDDEAVATDYGEYPTISVYLQPDELVVKRSNKMYYNKLTFELVCSMSLDGVADEGIDNIPRFKINQEMNKMVADLKACFCYNNDLNCTASHVNVTRSRRLYNTNGNAFRVGDLVMEIEVYYAQSQLNPNLVKR